MRLEEFDYELPKGRIAQTPVEPRDAARLLVDRGAAAAAHGHVRDLPRLLRPGDVVVVNDSKVLPARLRLRRSSGGGVEVLLLEQRSDGAWEALVRPSRRVGDGERLVDADGVPVVTVGERRGDFGTRLVRLLTEDVAATLQRHGVMPLPPYVKTPLGDPDRYQTVYARRPGSAAAPTAGLHLTRRLLTELHERGIDVAAVELMVGLDTFVPVTHDDPERHRIHSERYDVPEATMRRCRSASRVVAVGTTAARALESAATTGADAGRTDLFIRRGYEWKLVDVLLTNFHLPRTTLLMMIDAFVGARWRTLYDTALAEGYRFASFGDAMLLDRSAA